jgi:aldehyde:ferredoxin oxidoreductase
MRAGASKGHFISKAELTQMRDEYYTARGWNVETGAPTQEKLSELGLDYTAEQLAKRKIWSLTLFGKLER